MVPMVILMDVEVPCVSSMAGTPAAPIGTRCSSLVRGSRPSSFGPKPYAQLVPTAPDHTRAADLACAAVASGEWTTVCYRRGRGARVGRRAPSR